MSSAFRQHILIYAFSDSIVNIIFQRGSFTTEDTAIVSPVQAYFAFQIPFYVAGIVVVRLISALRANHILMWGAAINLVVNIGFNILFIHYLGLKGIALSTSFVYLISFLFLVYFANQTNTAGRTDVKIAFIISSLGSGGAERVLSLMANYWAQKNYSIIVITLDNSTPFYLLEDGIKLEPLSLLKNSVSVFSAIANNITRIKIIRKKLIEIDPDIVISFMTETNIIATIGCRMINKPIIIAERISYDFLKSWVWVRFEKY